MGVLRIDNVPWRTLFCSLTVGHLCIIDDRLLVGELDYTAAPRSAVDLLSILTEEAKVLDFVLSHGITSSIELGRDRNQRDLGNSGR